MAENSKRKSSRNFNLEKRQERHFDLDKEESNVVNIVDNSKISNISNQQTPTKESDTPIFPNHQNGDESQKKSKSWLWILLILAVAVIAFICYKGCSKQTEEPVPTVENPQKPTKPDENLSSMLPQEDTLTAVNVVEESETADHSSNQVPTNNSNTKNSTVSVSQTKSLAQPASSSIVSLSNDLEENARRVIRGDFGNGQARKKALGDKYAEIQNRINEIYKEKGLL